MSEIREQVDDAITVSGGTDGGQARQVLRNPRFMALFGSQIFTQVGGNMVLFGLTITVFGLTNSNTSVSLLLLTFLVPAVIFGAIAGVFVDMFDRRTILVVTNFARGALFLLLVFFTDQLAVIYVVTALVATLTTFFAPAEAAMIPLVVKRDQLMTANSLFILALQGAFVLGFAVLGPLAQTIVGTQALIFIVAAAYGLGGLLCLILPPAPAGQMGGATLQSARSAVAATFDQLKEGIRYIRDHHNIFWSLTYLAMVASLIGVLGVIAPAFTRDVLGLEEGQLIVILLPLGVGLVSGIAILSVIGKYLPRRRLIEGGMVALALSLVILGLAQEFMGQSGDDRSHGTAGGRHRGGLRGRHLLRLRRGASPDLAPGGAAIRRSGPRVRRAEHAREHGLVHPHHHRGTGRRRRGGRHGHRGRGAHRGRGRHPLRHLRAPDGHRLRPTAQRGAHGPHDRHVSLVHAQPAHPHALHRGGHGSDPAHPHHRQPGRARSCRTGSRATTRPSP